MAASPLAIETPAETPADARPSFWSEAFIAPLKRHPWRVLTVILGIIAINLWAWGLQKNDVLDAAYAIPDGGGYCALSDSGVDHAIQYNGFPILSASKGGTYCCGYTFEVAMQIAQERGLLNKKTASQIRRFQQEWYGVEPGSEAKQCATAVVHLGIGREIPMAAARPGDFVAFQRTDGFGHSVVFLGWIRDKDAQIIGLRYRSSQQNTNGVSDDWSFFANADGNVLGTIDRDHVFFARLNRPFCSHIIYPFGA